MASLDSFLICFSAKKLIFSQQIDALCQRISEIMENAKRKEEELSCAKEKTMNLEEEVSRLRQKTKIGEDEVVGIEILKERLRKTQTTVRHHYWNGEWICRLERESRDGIAQGLFGEAVEGHATGGADPGGLRPRPRSRPRGYRGKSRTARPPRGRSTSFQGLPSSLSCGNTCSME